MAVTYFKRFRMELKLDALPPMTIHLPAGFFLQPWSPKLLNRHAEVKWCSFRDELDAHVFPCLAELEGCRHLMREITGRRNFVPEATWLACRRNDFDRPLSESRGPFRWGSRHAESESAESWQPCGTIQGLMNSGCEGAIQNLGVHPECRDLGIGRALLYQALRGFRDAGCRYVNLEVTVQNTAAIRLYERFGFKKVETLFKISEVQFA